MTNTWPGWQNAGLIGEGSFGKVYKIRREEFGQTYEAALKVITIPASQADVRTAYEEGMDEASVTQYFRSFVEEIVAEFALMSKLKGNSNIVSYEDHMVVEHEDGIGWDILIRMELLTALPDYAAKHPLTEADVIHLGRDLSQALTLCRREGIVHRDIKPENIFVSKNGDFKLGDFGVARVAEKTVSAMSRKGTYNYMAPEVYKGEEYGYAADLYSLGLVLYRFLNDNRTPFLPPYPQLIQYSDREKALNRRIGGEPLPPPVHGSEELKRIVLKACAFRPEERYGSVEKFREELERLWFGKRAVQQEPVKEFKQEKAETKLVSEMGTEEELEKTVSVFSDDKNRLAEKRDLPLQENGEEGQQPKKKEKASETQNVQTIKRKGNWKKRLMTIGLLAAVAAMLAICVIIVKGAGAREKRRLIEKDSKTSEEFIALAEIYLEEGRTDLAWHLLYEVPEDMKALDEIEEERQKVLKLLDRFDSGLKAVQLNEYGAIRFVQRFDYRDYDTLEVSEREFLEMCLPYIVAGDAEALTSELGEMFKSQSMAGSSAHTYTYMGEYKIAFEYTFSGGKFEMEIRPENGVGYYYNVFRNGDGELNWRWYECGCKNWQWEGNATGKKWSGIVGYSDIQGTMSAGLRTGEWVEECDELSRVAVSIYEDGLRIKSGHRGDFRLRVDDNVGLVAIVGLDEVMRAFLDMEKEEFLHSYGLEEIYW